MEAAREKYLAWLSLLASSGTLVCCALPIALVSFGLGAAAAALASQLPFLVTLSVYKEWIFVASAVLLAAAGWLSFRPGRECPADPALAAACERTRMWNRRVLLVSAAAWGIGFFAAYLALPLRRWLET